MSRVDAIKNMIVALIENNEGEFIRIIEGFLPTTAIVLYLLVQQKIKNEKELLDRSNKWIINRVGGKTADGLKK